MDIFIGSQNIYDRSGKVIACELLYRNSMVNKYDENISSLSASYSIIKNIIDLGLDIITGGKVALINCDDKILSDDILSILPKDKVFIELLETIKPNKEVLEKIKKLNEHGFKLVLDDVIDLSRVMEFMPYICCVKVDY